MRIQDIGAAIRKARLDRGWTQARLAREAGLSRETLNLLENGLAKDLGVRKVLALFARLGLDVAVQPRPGGPDYVRMASTAASVSYRSVLQEEELIRSLLTGKVPRGKEAHIRTLLDEAPSALLDGLAAEAARWSTRARLERNLLRLAEATGASRKVSEWLKTG